MARVYVFNRYDKLSSNCYALVSDGEYCIVDPCISLSDAMQRLGASQYPKYVLLTHEHIDHLWELQSYADEGIEVICSVICAANMTDPDINCSTRICGAASVPTPAFLEAIHGQIIEIGSEELEVVKTPGHSAGSVCYLGHS